MPTNEQFLDAYWACLHGGIVPVPVAIGISDEHKHKLLRIARLLGNPLLYTTAKLSDRLAAFASEAGDSTTWSALAARTFLIEQLDDVSRAGAPARVRPEDTAFIQFSSGSTSEPKGVVLTHANILANADGAMQAAGFNESDTSLSWMPLTHDMGLIGMHLFMIYAGVRQYLMPTDLFVRRAVLWMKFAAQKKVTVTCSPNFGYRHFLRALGDKALDDVDLSARSIDLQRRRADLGRTGGGIPRSPGPERPRTLGDVPGLRSRRSVARRDHARPRVGAPVHQRGSPHARRRPGDAGSPRRTRGMS